MARNHPNNKTPERVSAQPRLHQRAAEIQAYGTVSHLLPLDLEEPVRLEMTAQLNQLLADTMSRPPATPTSCGISGRGMCRTTQLQASPISSKMRLLPNNPICHQCDNPTFDYAMDKPFEKTGRRVGFSLK